MRFGTIPSLFVVLFGMAACAAPDVNGDVHGHRGGDDDDDAPKTGKVTETPATDDTTTATTASAETGDVKPPTTETTTPPAATIKDADNDGIADDVDCAPNDASIAGTTIAIDDLTTDKGLIAPAPKFGLNWSFDGGYRQTRLANAPDYALFQKDARITEATVELTAASTEIGNVGTPTLRQMFITFGSTVTDGIVNAVGCGLEVDGTQTVTQKTTVAKLNGGPGGITTTTMNRVDRGAVQAGEEFKMKAVLKDGVLTCSVTIKGTDTTTAKATVGTLTGSIGLYTKQTKALFKSVNACKFK